LSVRFTAAVLGRPSAPPPPGAESSTSRVSVPSIAVSFATGTVKDSFETFAPNVSVPDVLV
jgi:hypothetical protein